jgi:hypothetical protein
VFVEKCVQIATVLIVVLIASCPQVCAERYNISREEQDEFGIQSYTRAADAWKNVSLIYTNSAFRMAVPMQFLFRENLLLKW